MFDHVAKLFDLMTGPSPVPSQVFVLFSIFIHRLILRPCKFLVWFCNSMSTRLKILGRGVKSPAGMLFKKNAGGYYVIHPLHHSNPPTPPVCIKFSIQNINGALDQIVLGRSPNQRWRDEKKIRVAGFWKYFERVAIPKSLRTPALTDWY
jgi:hypothetical protein